ncbi:FAD-dependent monooxygenase [Jannaschia sp. Os4]|uniref:FAD-dependent monooxygenase n=1 Tax=Jannaschia sp. Os4 TaxID=2807617 RepID=UPI001EEF18E7|nr:FAD-dependent monooxygenase [Jannaschia sp. Os4]
MDAIIIGGGLNGPLTALALDAAGLRSVVLDAGAAPDLDRPFDGRAYSLALGSMRMLGALGLTDGLVSQPILGIRASDGRPGEGAAPLFLDLDHAEVGEGPLGHMVEDRHLRAALHRACAAEGIEMRFGARVVDQAPGRVTLEGGEALEAALVVGCDGRASGTAQRAGLRRLRKDYGQTSLVCAVEHARDHEGIAHQFFMPAGPLAILPLTGRRSSLVWTEDRDVAEELNALPDDQYLDLLRPRFGSFLGALSLVGKRGTYPLTLDLATELVAERIALVGDAGHGIHPIAGQGLNLGVKDAAALAQVVADARRRGEDFGSLPVLRRYQRWRRFDATAMALATDGVNRLFSNDDPVLRGLRDLGMGVVSRTGPLRRGFMRIAAGVAGDVPNLLRGERP